MVAFNNTAYFEAFRSTSTLREALGNEESPPKFSYGQISFSKFSEKYSSSGWVGRKFAAIPFVAVGLVKTIYDLAMAVFSPTLFNIHYFQAAKNLQDLFGWTATIVNDQYGQYHVQESDFHKSFSDYFFAKHNVYSFERTSRFSRFENEFQQYLKKDMIDEAESMLERLLHPEPSSKDQFFERLALACLIGGKPERFASVIERIKFNPVGPCLERIAFKRIAFEWSIKGEVEPLRTVLDWIKRNLPDDDAKKQLLENINANLLFEFIDTKRLNEALEITQASISDDLTRNYYFKLIAQAYLKDNQVESARSVAEQIRPQNARLIREADAYARSGNKKEFAEALRQNKITADPLFEKIATIYFQNGCIDSAFSIAKRIQSTEKKLNLIRRIRVAFEEVNRVKSLEVNDYELILLLSDWNRGYRIKSDLILRNWYELTADAAFCDFAGTIYEFLEKIALSGLLGRSIKDFNELAFQELMNQEAGLTFIKKTVEEWLQYNPKSENPVLQSNSNLFTNYLNSRFSSDDLHELEKLFAEDLEAKFGDFLRLAQDKGVKIQLDPYKVLGVDRNASQAEIKSARNRLALHHHPDKLVRGQSEKEADFEERKASALKRFREVDEAFKQLVV